MSFFYCTCRVLPGSSALLLAPVHPLTALQPGTGQAALRLLEKNAAVEWGAWKGLTGLAPWAAKRPAFVED